MPEEVPACTDRECLTEMVLEMKTQISQNKDKIREFIDSLDKFKQHWENTCRTYEIAFEEYSGLLKRIEDIEKNIEYVFSEKEKKAKRVPQIFKSKELKRKKKIKVKTSHSKRQSRRK